jgi:hypothetical protein
LRSARAGMTLLPEEWQHGPHYRAARERAALPSVQANNLPATYLS